MGREPRPRREELEFIFELFLKGYDDGGVLAHYTSLEEKGQLKFPYRIDYRLIKQLREEFMAARFVLEPYLRQQIDPVVAKAREDHLSDIAQLLKNWRDQIKSAQLLDAHATIYNVEEEPLFEYILHHCPLVKVEYEALKDQREQYDSTEEEMARTIGREATEPGKNENYDKLVARYAVYAALGQSLPHYKMEGNSLRIHEGHESKTIATGSPATLDRCLELHKKLIGKYKGSPDVQCLLAIREKLPNLQKSLLKTIELALNERSYIRQKCEACPDLNF